MGYTKHVDQGSRNPGRQTAYRSFYFSFTPPLFCEMTGSAPVPFPPRAGAFSCLWGGREKDANFSKPVHTLFTHGGGKWGILNTSAGERAESSAGSTPIIFLFLFYPFLNKRKRPALDLPLRRQGVFPSAGLRRKMQKKRQVRKVLGAKCAAKEICKKPFKVCSRFVHNLPPEMGYTNLAGRENTRPPASFFNLFSFFHLFFLPSFSFCIGTPCPPDGGQGASICPGKAATNLSQAIQNLFTHCAPRRSILNTSAGEAASPTLNAYQSLFLFYPPFSNLCSESASAAVPFPPTGGGALLYAAGSAPPSPEPDENGAASTGARDAAVWGFQSPAAARTLRREWRLSENLIKISQERRTRALAETRGMRYTKHQARMNMLGVVNYGLLAQL